MPDPHTLALLYHSPMVGHAVIDSDKRIHRANPAFARFTRYSAQQLEGLPLATVLHPDSSLPGAEEQARLRYRSSDGQLLWGDTCILPLDGDQTGFVLQVCDRTRVQLEQQLHKGRAQVLELLYRDHSLPAICEAIVHHIETLGEGMRCSILLLDAERGTLHRVMAQPPPMRACWSEPIVANDGTVIGSFALYYDTPREPRPEEIDLIVSAASLTAIAISFKRGEEVLRNLDRAKDEFISTAAHELRTPLTAIMGYADLLVAGESNPALQREFATEISEGGEALERLINDLLDLSIIQIGRGLVLKQQPTELLPMVERVVMQIRRNTPRHQLELHCAPGIPEFVSCDAGRITQVLENLLSNAIKYSPQGGAVVLEIKQIDAALHFCVSDQGIGMNEAEQQQAFDKFYRANSSSTAPRGLGLGLCIVRQIVEGHGGKIELKSRPQEGTRVTFTLPL